MTVLSNLNCNSCLHRIVSHTNFFRCWNNFFYSIGMCTNFRIVKWQFSKCHCTIFFVGNSFNFLTSWIFKNKVEFSVFKFTSSQFLREVKFNFYWCYYIVVENLIIITWFESTFSTVFNSCLQFTFRILSYSNCHGNSHCVVVNVCIRTLLFSDLVFISTSFVKSKLAECSFSILVGNSFFVLIRSTFLFC